MDEESPPSTPRQVIDGKDEDSEEETGEDRSDAGQGCGSEGDWGSLPDLCLRQVFAYLPDRDRRCANLVCRRWRDAMRSPSLWRSHYFYLSGRLSKLRRTECCSAVAYVRSLGAYLERLDVCVYPPYRALEAQRLVHSFRKVFFELTRVKAPLKSLSLVGLEFDRPCWTLKLSTSVVECLVLFLQRGASSLTSVRLRGMRTTMNQGLDLLCALENAQRHYNSQRYISSLDLKGFFCSHTQVYRDTTFPRILHYMPGLTNLSLSYSCLSDELLIAFQHRRRGQRNVGSLQTLSLHCTLNEPHDQVVCGDSWKTLALSCPGLRVKLTVDQIINSVHLARILLPEIPLTEYTMTAFYSPDEHRSARSLLRRMLPRYRHSLQFLNLDLSNCRESLDEVLLELVKACYRLEQLKVWAFLEIRTVQRLLHIRLTQRSLLNKIAVRIYSLRENTTQQADKLKETLSSYLNLPPELDFYAKVYPLI